jgi:hypothetical protein
MYLLVENFTCAYLASEIRSLNHWVDAAQRCILVRPAVACQPRAWTSKVSKTRGRTKGNKMQWPLSILYLIVVVPCIARNGYTWEIIKCSYSCLYSLEFRALYDAYDRSRMLLSTKDFLKFYDKQNY